MRMLFLLVCKIFNVFLEGKQGCLGASVLCCSMHLRHTGSSGLTFECMLCCHVINVRLYQLKCCFQGFWIGLYDDVNSWRWSLSNTSFYRDGEAEFRLWKDGEPNNYNSREHCTALIGRRWVDDDCINCYKSVCMDVRGLNVTFVFIETPMNWTEAQSYCREHHTDLASVRNMTENQKVADLVPAGQLAWIGLYRDSWKWSDGSDSSFRHWAQGQPNKDDRSDACVVADFSKDGTWLDIPCDLNRPFICYTAVQTTSSSSTTTSSTTQPDAVTVTTKQVIKVRLVRKDSSLDLNDPAVMEQMLKEVQQRLKDQGVKGDVKLSWRKQADGKVFHKEEEETKEKKTRRKRDEF
ncbi:C-type mannose receptor 2-like isoform 11-T11 [Acanthopagrus schlegelii]